MPGGYARLTGSNTPSGGYIWHHHPDAGTMQLVVASIHMAYQHEGGRARNVRISEEAGVPFVPIPLRPKPYTAMIEFGPDTLPGPFDEKELSQSEGWLRLSEQCEGRSGFDPACVGRLRAFNGGRLRTNGFVPPSGHERLVERFFHFADLPKEHPSRVSPVAVVWSQ